MFNTNHYSFYAFFESFKKLISRRFFEVCRQATHKDFPSSDHWTTRLKFFDIITGDESWVFNRCIGQK